MTRTVPRKWLSLAFLVGGILLTASVDARAGLQLSLTQGTAAPVTLTIATPPGVIASGGVIGDYTVTFIASSSNSPGGADATLSITSLEITRTGSAFADPLYITASATDYAVPTSAGSFSASYTGNFNSSVAGDSLTFDSYFDPGNNNMAQTPPIVFGAGMSVADQLAVGTAAGVTALATQSFISPGGVTNSGALATPHLDVLNGGTFSLTSRIQITEAVGSRVLITTTATVSPVPEPATMAMAFTALPLLGLGYMRRRRTQA